MGAFGFNNQGQFQVGGHAVKYGKNYIINGGFDYWNYATSQTITGYGSDDRWYNANIGSTKTHSQVLSGDTERALFNSSKFSRTVVTSVAGAGNLAYKTQAIENVTKLAGKTVTISFWAKADVTKNIAIELIQSFGTGGTPSATVTSIGSQLVALTSTWQKKTITVTIPSIVGKTLGTDGVHTSTVGLFFWLDAGSNFATRTASLGQQSGTFDIAEVKLEEGSVATPWTPYEGEFGGEVQACQRYLPVWLGYGASCYTTSTTNANTVIPFNAVPRIAPTGIITTANLFFVNSNAGNFTASAISLNVAGLSSAVVAVAISGATGDRPAHLLTNNSTAKILFTGCEL